MEGTSTTATGGPTERRTEQTRTFVAKLEGSENQLSVTSEPTLRAAIAAFKQSHPPLKSKEVVLLFGQGDGEFADQHSKKTFLENVGTQDNPFTLATKVAVDDGSELTVTEEKDVKDVKDVSCDWFSYLVLGAYVITVVAAIFLVAVTALMTTTDISDADITELNLAKLCATSWLFVFVALQYFQLCRDSYQPVATDFPSKLINASGFYKKTALLFVSTCSLVMAVVVVNIPPGTATSKMIVVLEQITATSSLWLLVFTAKQFHTIYLKDQENPNDDKSKKAPRTRSSFFARRSHEELLDDE